MGWGLGSIIIPYYPLNYIIQVILAVLVINYFFGSVLQDAISEYKLQFFEYPFWLPSWRIFIVLVVIAAFLSAIQCIQCDLINSLIRGVIVSAILEEFIARSFFVRYKMGVKEFIAFNVLSSLAFTGMHGFYVQSGVSMYDLLQRGHFGFSFMLGVVVYNTRRIEASILLHMFSNLFRYTIPVCLFHCPWPSYIAIIASMVVDVVFILFLGECRYKKRTMN